MERFLKKRQRLPVANLERTVELVVQFRAMVDAHGLIDGSVHVCGSAGIRTGFGTLAVA